METFFIKAIQLIMSLSLLVLIHEGGHFLFARLFKTRVNKFCLFFDPWFTLFKFKPKKSETEYAIGWLPLGGYVQIDGMVDETQSADELDHPVQPWEFRAKPAWQRLFIMIGGVLFNFLLALFIYSMILFTWGDEYIPVQQAPLGMSFNETAKSIGFKDGDVLISADGVPFERMNTDLLTAVVDARQVTVMRDGVEASVYIPEDMMQRLMADSVRFASFRVPYVIDSVVTNTPAFHAGLQAGDRITHLDGKAIDYNEFLSEMYKRRESNGPHEIQLTYIRRNQTDTLTLMTDSTYRIGVMVNPDVMPTIRKEYGFFEAFPAGIALGVNTLKGYVGQMKYLFSKEGAKQLGGFGAIGSIFPSTWDWHQFWYMTAFLSIILAFMNILPIPALDGGHVLFLLYEIIARRKPSDKFMERAQMIGMLLLLTLLIWANLNDILRMF
ncbi:MAG: RIP metalloprotease RseP [Mediterranea massiliensis]|nr:RIP metalloprotease RseP [Mediterranea massiliensis]